MRSSPIRTAPNSSVDKISGFETGSSPAASVVGRDLRFGRGLGLLALARRLVDRVDVGAVLAPFVRLLGPVTFLDLLPRKRLVYMVAHDTR